MQAEPLTCLHSLTGDAQENSKNLQCRSCCHPPSQNIFWSLGGGGLREGKLLGYVPLTIKEKNYEDDGQLERTN